MSTINHELISEIIFTNDETFTDINIKDAIIIARVCKVAKINKNIKLSYDNRKIDIYHSQIKCLSMGKKENDYIVEGVKEKMVIEQKENILKYFIKLNVKLAIVMEYNNITDDDDDADAFEDDDDYINIEYEIALIITVFKYNSYFINMLSKTLVNEKDVIRYINSKYFTKNWCRIPIIFPKSLLIKIGTRRAN